MALLLQLVLPLAGLQQAAAQPGPNGPLLICTGTGLVWVNLDGTPIEDKGQTASHCPYCPARAHAGVALLPTAPVLLRRAASLAPPTAAAPAALAPATTAPPLPARGPPWA